MCNWHFIIIIYGLRIFLQTLFWRISSISKIMNSKTFKHHYVHNVFQFWQLASFGINPKIVSLVCWVFLAKNNSFVSFGLENWFWNTFITALVFFSLSEAKSVQVDCAFINKKGKSWEFHKWCQKNKTISKRRFFNGLLYETFFLLKTYSMYKTKPYLANKNIKITKWNKHTIQCYRIVWKYCSLYNIFEQKTYQNIRYFSFKKRSNTGKLLLSLLILHIFYVINFINCFELFETVTHYYK